MRGTLFLGFEGLPLAIHIRLEPRGKVHRTKRRLQADVAEIAGAVARGNVSCSGQKVTARVREVAADTGLLTVGVPRRLGRARVRVAERDVLVHEVANRLNRSAPVGAFPNSDQGNVRQPVGFAVSTSQQKLQALLGKLLHRMLPSGHGVRFHTAGVVDDGVRSVESSPAAPRSACTSCRTYRGRNSTAPTGLVVSTSGTTMSLAREWWMFHINIIGVG